MSSVDAQELMERLAELSESSVKLKKKLIRALDKNPTAKLFSIDRKELDHIVYHIAALDILAVRAMTTIMQIAVGESEGDKDSVEEFLDSFRSFIKETETYKRCS